MSFKIEYSPQSLKFLKKADRVLAQRLLTKLDGLIITPIGHDTKSVHGYKQLHYRVRVGRYRILYYVDYSQNTIYIVRIDDRSKVY